MKQFLINLFNKAGIILEKDLSTSNRPLGFRITILTILAANIFCIAFYIIKTAS
ncbi:MAG TPA: hypothetical protein VF487_04065 [Chitinophagaceae bacterium]